MNNISRKQREILQREQLILDTAAELLQTVGYMGLSMERIAEAIEYSKGTIYQHFTCKEEILCSLCIRCMQTQHDMFEKAASFNGRPREKMTAILTAHQLFVKLHPREFGNMQIIKTVSIRDKIAEDSRTDLQLAEDSCMFLIGGIIQEAIAAGDLHLVNVKPFELLFSMWATAFGSSMLQASDIPLAQKGITDADQVMRRHCRFVLDGYGWQPLSRDWDYDATQRRINAELFAEEIAQLARLTNAGKKI
jgi:AcrR family transcriptional regulator